MTKASLMVETVDPPVPNPSTETQKHTENIQQARVKHSEVPLVTRIDKELRMHSSRPVGPISTNQSWNWPFLV